MQLLWRAQLFFMLLGSHDLAIFWLQRKLLVGTICVLRRCLNAGFKCLLINILGLMALPRWKGSNAGMACLNNAQATRVTAGYGSSESSSQMEIDAYVHLFLWIKLKEEVPLMCCLLHLFTLQKYNFIVASIVLS